MSAIILTFGLEGLAQSGPDPRINPLSTCNEDYLSKEYVFLGQVRAVKEELEATDNDGHGIAEVMFGYLKKESISTIPLHTTQVIL